jgi:hypothetical protein
MNLMQHYQRQQLEAGSTRGAGGPMSVFTGPRRRVPRRRFIESPAGAQMPRYTFAELVRLMVQNDFEAVARGSSAASREPVGRLAE